MTCVSFGLCWQGDRLESLPALSADERRLIDAAVSGDVQVVREMLAKGVSPNVRNCETYPLED